VRNRRLDFESDLDLVLVAGILAVLCCLGLIHLYLVVIRHTEDVSVMLMTAEYFSVMSQ